MHGLFSRARRAVCESNGLLRLCGARWRALAAFVVRMHSQATLLCHLELTRTKTCMQWRGLAARMAARVVELRQRSMLESPTCDVDENVFGAPIVYCRNLQWFLQKMAVCAHCKKSDYMARFMNGLATEKSRARYFLLCDSCRVVQYCSRECQQIDWQTHRTQCAMRTGQLRRHTLLRKYLWWYTRHSFNGHWCTYAADGHGRARAAKCDGDCFYPHFWWWYRVKRELVSAGAYTAVVRIVAGMPPTDVDAEHMQRIEAEARDCGIDYERENAWLRWRPMRVSDARRVLPAVPRHVWHLILRESKRHTMFVWRDEAGQWHYELLRLEHGECDSD